MQSRGRDSSSKAIFRDMGATQTVKVPFQYKDAGYVYNGRFPAAVEKDSKLLWGVADLDGEVVLPIEYDCVEWVDLMPDTTRYHGRRGWLWF